MGFHFGLGLRDRAVVHASYHNVILAATRPGTTGACGTCQVIIHLAQLVQVNPRLSRTKCHTVGSTPKVVSVKWINLGCVATASPLGP